MHDAHGRCILEDAVDVTPFKSYSSTSVIFNEVNLASTLEHLGQGSDHTAPLTLVVSHEPADASATDVAEQVKLLREAAGRTAFLVLWHPCAIEDPVLRCTAFDSGANMVTHSQRDLSAALSKVVGQRGGGAISCHMCGLTHLTAEDYWHHLPLYHINAPNVAALCVVCNKTVPNLQVHVHEAHNPSGPCHEERLGIGSAVIVHRLSDDKFLMVQEFAGQGFWLPGGGLDRGETLRDCAVRECVEEAGVRVELVGVAQVQEKDMGAYHWRLVTFYATLVEDGGEGELVASRGAKTVPDFESVGACWVSASELDAIPLRCAELPRAWFGRLSGGGHPLVFPMELPGDVAHLFGDVAF
ncbi:hypothetical protein FOA52_006870 [Chlamydomonas sp. UWO 241]|nr:hypothetical protein FOA52_006870 [Chlamydomonas sp. UWO 241]